MFKGLRTKIESEQKSQTSIINRNVRGSPTQGVSTKIKDTGLTASSQHTGSEFISSKQSTSENNGSNTLISRGSPNINDAPRSNSPSKEKKNIFSKKNDKSDDGLNKLEQLNLNDVEVDQDADVETLRGLVVKLKEHLKAVMREKVDIDDQNAQLYQMIDQLRRSLEIEQETNSSLREKLNGLESQLKDKTDINNYNNCMDNDNTSSNKPFKPDGIPSINACEPNIPQDTESFRNEIIELQAQLAKKNRQLKIRQQNLNDIKKTLQKEILDHSRTQDELARIQKQLQINEQASQNQLLNTDKKTLSNQNGSSQTEPCDTVKKNYLNQALGDINQEFKESSSSQVGAVSSTQGEDTFSLNATLGGGINVQFDRLSCLSRSSASVDDFESNDLQQSNYVREVSHEYLRNVLFRYMISTEKETTQHLVKAISVLMDFTPEQSAAIKSAMNSRSSWLRLK